MLTCVWVCIASSRVVLISPYPEVGFIEKSTGKVELEVDADVILSAKPLYTSASVGWCTLRVRLTRELEKRLVSNRYHRKKINKGPSHGHFS